MKCTRPRSWPACSATSALHRLIGIEEARPGHVRGLRRATRSHPCGRRRRCSRPKAISIGGNRPVERPYQDAFAQFSFAIREASPARCLGAMATLQVTISITSAARRGGFGADHQLFCNGIKLGGLRALGAGERDGQAAVAAFTDGGHQFYGPEEGNVELLAVRSAPPREKMSIS